MRQLVLLLLCASCVVAQERTYERVDFQTLEAEVSGAAGSAAYARLMERYTAGDTALTVHEYRQLYYGYTFLRQYNPYRTSEHDKILRNLYSNPNPTPATYDSIIHFASLAVAEFPFDIRQMRVLAAVCRLNGDTAASDCWRRKRIGVLRAILSTGDGITCETGITVIAVSHEYEIMRLFELEVQSQSLYKGGCDGLKVKDAPEGKNVVFFDINRMLEVQETLLKSGK